MTVMKVLDYISEIEASGLLCEEYAERVRSAKSKKRLFDIVCDANGVSWLPELREKGFPIDYSIAHEEFGRYINGKCKPEFESPTGGTYTSAFYCQYNEVSDIVVDTTLACFLGCINDVWIAPFNVARIVLDGNTDLNLHCPDNASCVVECYGNANVDIIEGADRVRIRRMG